MNKATNFSINLIVYNNVIFHIPKYAVYAVEGPIRKCQDYVYVKREYRGAMWKIKHYLRHENKVVSYCEVLRYMWNYN